MMEVARRRFLPPAACGLLLVASAAGCSEKPQPARDEKPSGAASEGEAESPGAGVGDAVDYLTGKTPLTIKKRTEEKLDRITRERQEELEELLGADDATRPPE